jgi:methyl-accepting chemotaxis protein
MYSNIMRLELLISSVMPAAAVLTVGVVGIRQMVNIDIRFFLAFVIGCATAVFFGEMAVLQLFQRATREQSSELVAACQEYLAGNRERRATIQGDTSLTALATLVNTLLDTASQANQEQKHSSSSNATRKVLLLTNQLQHLIHDIAPVTKGDLRVRIEVPEGEVGIIADICHALIEELSDLVKWTRYSSEQVIGATATLLRGTVELAQTVETQMLRFSETTEAVEKLVAFIQRLSNALQLSTEMTRTIRSHLQEQADHMAQPGEPSSRKNTSSVGALFTSPLRQSQDFVERLNTDIERQAKLLEEVSRSTQLHTAQGESMVTDLYSFAQRIHLSSTGILQTAEDINALARLAKQWQDAVNVFQLPEQEE